MITQHCIVKHNPPNSYGDCIRAAVASILNIERTEDVPHFAHDDPGGEVIYERLKEWLAPRGLAPFYIPADGAMPLEQVLNTMKVINPGVHYLLFGRSQNADHVVIGRDDKIVHDPSWYSSSIVGPNADGNWIILVFVPVVLCQ